eukprot:4833185-Ditylum_brightwellii.AAC.1
MASLLVGRLAAIARFLITCVAYYAHDAFITQGEGEVVKVAHRMHVGAVILDCFFDLVLDKRVQ